MLVLERTPRITAEARKHELFVSVDAVNLPAWDHADPLDRIIVATARRLGAALVTADSAILDYAAATKAVRVIEA